MTPNDEQIKLAYISFYCWDNDIWYFVNNQQNKTPHLHHLHKNGNISTQIFPNDALDIYNWYYVEQGQSNNNKYQQWYTRFWCWYKMLFTDSQTAKAEYFIYVYHVESHSSEFIFNATLYCAASWQWYDIYTHILVDVTD